jgi:hypothetical protein
VKLLTIQIDACPTTGGVQHDRDPQQLTIDKPKKKKALPSEARGQGLLLCSWWRRGRVELAGEHSVVNPAHIMAESLPGLYFSKPFEHLLQEPKSVSHL